MAAENRDPTAEQRDEALNSALEQMSAENLTTTEGIRVDIVQDDIDAPIERVWGIG